MHKNSYGKGVLIGNFVEERMSKEVKESPSRLNSSTVYQSSFDYRTVTQPGPPPPQVGERDYVPPPDSAFNLPSHLMFGHGAQQHFQRQDLNSSYSLFYRHPASGESVPSRKVIDCNTPAPPVPLSESSLLPPAPKCRAGIATNTVTGEKFKPVNYPRAYDEFTKTKDAKWNALKLRN
eukprot:GILI01016584.1.p1 GENE.GILI01016584.1~~GILI01016584.1.p1  ORF type:complete len:178 (+),score=65.09 GILI01016584.1:84-617(+)